MEHLVVGVDEEEDFAWSGVLLEHLHGGAQAHVIGEAAVDQVQVGVELVTRRLAGKGRGREDDWEGRAGLHAHGQGESPRISGEVELPQVVGAGVDVVVAQGVRREGEALSGFIDGGVGDPVGEAHWGGSTILDVIRLQASGFCHQGGILRRVHTD